MSILKVCRVANASQKDFKELNESTLELQGLKFSLVFKKENAIKVNEINGIKCENAYTYHYNEKINLKMFQVTNITKQNWKDLEKGKIEYAMGKFDDMPVKVTYDKEKDKYNYEIDINIMLYC